MPTSTRSSTEQALLQQIREAVLSVEPDAQIYLFGSRARGDCRVDSDWDFLILLDGPVDRARTSRVRHALFDIELEADSILSSIVRNADDWNSRLFCESPFYRSVNRDRVAV
jgi:predicted nucleotidyltransferase